jgi:hypothetical protein
MLARSSDERPTVHMPVPAEDRPSWAKIGVITLIGFAVGVTWPRLLGVRVGPHLPQVSSDTSIAAAEPDRFARPGAPALQPTTTPEMPGGSAHGEPASIVAPPTSSAVATGPAVSISVGRGIVTACRTADGESLRGADCGRTSSLDRVVAKNLQKLAECPALTDKPDKIRLVVRADFGRGAMAVSARKDAASEALVACAKSALEGVSLEGVAHVNPRVTVTYSVAFDSPTPAQPNERPPSTRDEGGNGDRTAQVVWDVALVRDTPRTGRVTARLKQGTVLHVGPAQDGWYPVKFGDAFSDEGWVYGAAIGR